MIYRPLYVEKIMAYVDTPFVKILTGVRRCGKSTILKMIMERLETQHNIPKERIVSCRYEDVYKRQSGMNVWEGRQERFDLTELACYRELKDTKRLERSLGTLGGGNHFIEIDEAGDGTKYLVIHSGSRNLGKQVAELYQKLAINLDRGYGDYLEKRDEIIRTYKEQGRRSEIQDALKQLHWQVYELSLIHI